MTDKTTIIHRAVAALGSVAMTVAIMVSYFAVPAANTVSGVIA